jgi:PAS domain S-box-containing protein
VALQIVCKKVALSMTSRDFKQTDVGSASSPKDDLVVQTPACRQCRFYDTLLSTITDFAYLFDLDGRFQFANKPLLDLWGLKLEQAVGKNFVELQYPQDLAVKLQGQIQQVIQTKARVVDQTEFTSAAGVTGYYEYIFSPVLGPDGSVEAVAGSTREITNQKQTEYQLRESEIQFRELADAMPPIVWAAKPDGTLDYYNRRWFEYVNLSPDSPEDARWDKFIHPEDLPRAHETWTASLRSGDPYVIEFRVRNGAGRYRWFLARALPIRNAKNVITRWFGTCSDIEHQKELQAERESLLESERLARSDAERASRMKDEFLATLSHELRTPLNAILGWSQIIRQSNDANDVAQGLEVIERNARSQSQIIEDLLDMSRIISGKVRLDVQRLDLLAIVNLAIDTARPAADAKGIRVQSVLDPLHNVVVSGDANRMQQILWNFLSNAVKFTPKGGRVQVLLQRIDSHLEISVVDSGEGIKPEFLPHVFNRFHQADSSITRRHGGLGLGLSIAKQLVELHGGLVRVNSEGLGKGSTFTIELPLTVVRPGAESQKSRRHPRVGVELNAPADDCAEINGVRVLVVDDEPDARALVKRVLEDCNAIVTIAGSVDEAFSLIERSRFDVLVSDIGMPGTDGYSFIKRVRALDKSKGGDIPAIALTAYARAEDRVRAVAAGFTMHVAKPVEPIELITMVAGAAGRTGR